MFLYLKLYQFNLQSDSCLVKKWIAAFVMNFQNLYLINGNIY